ncbi:MAG: hypothetical protein CM15mV129_180 [uncultured marine virus]|nr:MAG: hypothetical protein CM15mV129_180 [uncultured marine virus]
MEIITYIQQQLHILQMQKKIINKNLAWILKGKPNRGPGIVLQGDLWMT